MNTIKLPIGRNMFTIFDEDDYDLLKNYLWFYIGSKNKKVNGYVSGFLSGWIEGNRETILMHRLILNAPRNMVVDHINGDGLDNRRDNLRICTRQQNDFNRRIRTDNTSGYKGVVWSSRLNKWIAQIYVDGKRIHLGCHKDKKIAAQTYNNAAILYFKEFAQVNVV